MACDVQVMVFCHVMLCELRSSGMCVVQVIVFWHVMLCKLWSSGMRCCADYGILVCNAVQVMVFWHAMCRL